MMGISKVPFCSVEIEAIQPQGLNNDLRTALVPLAVMTKETICLAFA